MSKIFRERRGVDYLSICKFKKKSIEDNFFFRKFGWGAIAPQGVLKSQKVLRWIDRGSRDVFNGVKILALSSAQLQIKEFKFYFLKFLNLIFSKFCVGIFLNFSGNVEGSIVYRPNNFWKVSNSGKISGSNLKKKNKKKFGGPSLPRGTKILLRGRGNQ